MNMREERSSYSSATIDVQRRRYSIHSPSQFDSHVTVLPLIKRSSSKHFFPEKDSSMEKYQIVSSLNRGTFGRTYLIRDLHDGHLYLLKQIDRSLPDRYRSYLFQEQYLFSCLKSNSILSLISSYFDIDHQCYSMKFEYNRGFTLYHLLRHLRWFEESAVAFYAAQIVLIFEYLHELRIIYRNLKIETILLTKHGYIKLSDFAFAKVLPHSSDKTSTIVGVPDTIPPEMLLGQPYSYSVDWWQLGVAMFEMFTSHSPFFAHSMLNTHRNVLCQRPLNFPSQISSSSRMICRLLLEFQVNKRLGCSSGCFGAREVKGHSWFKQHIDWSTIIKQTHPAPYRLHSRWFDEGSRYSNEPMVKMTNF